MTLERKKTESSIHHPNQAEDLNDSLMHMRYDPYVHNLFMKAPVAIMILKGEEYRVEFANDTYLEMVGKDHDFIGHPIFQSIPELEIQGIRQLLDGVIKTGLPYHGNELAVDMLRKDKKIRGYYDFKYQPVKETGGIVSGIVVVATEVTEQVNARISMQESEHMYHELIYSSPFLMAIFKGRDMIVSIANDAILASWGKGKEVIGKSIFKALPETMDQGWVDILQGVFDTGNPFHAYEMPVSMVRNGQVEIVYYTFVYQAQRNIKCEIEGVAVIAHEVTGQIESRKIMLANELLQLENQKIEVTRVKLFSEYTRGLIEASLDPLITINTDGKITDMNKAMIEATDVPREKLIGTDFENYFTDSEKARNIYQEVFSKGYVINYPLTIKDHQLTDVLFNGSVYKNEQGAVVGAVVVARDITAQKRIEKELIEAKVAAELATLIAEESKSKAENATKLAEDAVKAKQQFLSNMSHEIRTPMNAIIGFTKVVLKTELSPKQKEYLAAIKTSGDALIVLINDILDLAKVNAGKMTFEHIPFKMATSLATMLHLFETKVQEKNLVLIKVYDQKIPNVLLGDPVRLHQIILNLVSNAVKFTAKGEIRVSVKLLQEDENSVQIEFLVADTGIGIPEDQTSTIFENFQQASNGTSRLFGGTGLGLAISKQLVEQQGGEISVESKIGEGSTFRFTLKFQKTTAEAALESVLTELDSETKSIKVLVVEDMELNQLLMKTVLDDFGFERDIASNGKFAIEKLKSNPYDIILMDLQMPEMNGFEATEYIRNQLRLKIPIIALTADVTTVDLDKCKAAGMDDYIAKPIDERLLYSKILGLVLKPMINNALAENSMENDANLKYTDLEYLIQRTKNNPQLIMEMIAAYLEQTPPLISAMKQSLQDKDWGTLHATVHKMIPSFSIMGMSSDFETMAKKIQEYAQAQLQFETITEMVLKIEKVCTHACNELEEAFNRYKNTKT